MESRHRQGQALIESILTLFFLILLFLTLEKLNGKYHPRRHDFKINKKFH